MEHYYYETELAAHGAQELGAQAIEFALFAAQAELPFGSSEHDITEVDDSAVQMVIQGEFDIQDSKELGQ